MYNSGNIGDNSRYKFSNILLVVWSCVLSSRNSIYVSSICNRVVGVVNIVFFQFFYKLFDSFY